MLLTERAMMDFLKSRSEPMSPSDVIEQLREPEYGYSDKSIRNMLCDLLSNGKLRLNWEKTLEVCQPPFKPCSEESRSC